MARLTLWLVSAGRLVLLGKAELSLNSIWENLLKNLQGHYLLSYLQCGRVGFLPSCLRLGQLTSGGVLHCWIIRRLQSMFWCWKPGNPRIWRQHLHGLHGHSHQWTVHHRYQHVHPILVSPSERTHIGDCHCWKPFQLLGAARLWRLLQLPGHGCRGFLWLGKCQCLCILAWEIDWSMGTTIFRLKNQALLNRESFFFHREVLLIVAVLSVSERSQCTYASSKFEI